MASKRPTLFGSIRNRLLYGSTLLTTLPLIILAVVLAYAATREAQRSLKARAQEQMQSIRVGKQAEIQSYFESVADNLVVIAGTTEVRKALIDLPPLLQALPQVLPIPIDEARGALGEYYATQFLPEYNRRNPGKTIDPSAFLAAQSDAAVAAQYFYIATNPNPLGAKGKLDQAAADPSAFSAEHASVHSLGRAAVERYGLYDFFLADMNGNVVYTFFKELDYASNLRTGPWARSGLAEAYLSAASGIADKEVRLTDFAPYVPSYEDEATFMSTPVYEGGRQVGVLMVQLPIEQVNRIMTFNGDWKNVGLGESGEVYLVGTNNTPRSISRFMQENSAGFIQLMKGLGTAGENLSSMETRGSNIGLMKIDTLGTREAFAGRTSVGVYPDYRGVPVLGSYAPLPILNQNWVILSEIDQSESDAPATQLRNQILLVAGLTLLIMAAIAAFFALRLARSINEPLAIFSTVVDKVTKGDNVARVRLAPDDEIGALGVAFDQMLDERIQTQQRIESENEQLNNSVVSIMTSVAELAGRDLRVKVPVSEDVTGAVSDAINMMTRSTAGALNRVRQISDTVSSASSSVRARSNQVHIVASAASGQATSAAAELQQTAMALREMGTQARDANAFAEQAIKTTTDAMEIVRATVTGISDSRDQIRETEKRVKRLGERSQEITGVVNIIGQIAERTSVLALNASMQAVAAGDAGRGFAVVADEVKRLAENARQATQQISSLVNAIQADTSETIQAMNGTIAQVVDISKLADRAGSQMSDTRSATEQLAAAVRSISANTLAQSEASKTLLTRAYELLQSSQQTLEEVESQRQDNEILNTSAQELVATVSEFRLPN